ncbi:MAG: hypothetical protein ACLU4J_27085, partial [Butyricimonas paravirosa]
VNTDLNLIMSQNFTENFLQQFDEKDNTILKNVYSTTNNGKLIEGLATAIMTSFYDDNRILTVTTDHSVLQMDPFDYVQGMVDNEIFFIPIPEERFKPMCLMYDNSAYYELLIMDHVVMHVVPGGGIRIIQLVWKPRIFRLIVRRWDVVLLKVPIPGRFTCMMN